jgi:hypothetical protein
MAREDFNTDWAYRPKVTAFQELGGSAGADWVGVTLPHDALIGTERRPDAPHGETSGYFPGGAFEYRKHFDVPDEQRGKHVVLEFDGVYRDAMVFVNGALAGQHAYGYSRFTVRIDPYLRFGATNEVRVECRTHLDSRWYTGVGIHRDVHLVVSDPIHFATDGVRVTTPDIDPSQATIEIEARVENLGVTTATVFVATVVTRPDGAEVACGRVPLTLLPGETGVARQRRYVADPQLWNVDSPNLYQARLKLLDGETPVDDQMVTFGIRSLQVDPRRGLRINGEPVKLRGACIHHDNGPLGAAAIARAEGRRVQLLKAAGFNAIRSAHNPASPALLDACDRLGMLVMDETFDCWTSGKADFDYAFDFPQWWERDVEAMVAKDYNHPSVILYSIGNEIPETGDRFGARLGRLMAEKIRSLDDARLVTNGLNGFVSSLDVVLAGMRQRRQAAATDAGGVNQLMAGFGTMMDQIQASPMVTERLEESFGVLDVIGLNYGEARYELDRDQAPDRVLVGAETWPTVIDRNWALVEANPHVLGDFTWTGWDHLGEVSLVPTRDIQNLDVQVSASTSSGYPGLLSWSGDLDITGHRRPASYYRETVFGLRTTPYIAVQRPERYGRVVAVATPWAWSDTVASWSWPAADGEPISVEVYSNADEIELVLDGTAVGRAMVGESRAFRADFDLTYTPGELVAIAYTAGVETGRTVLRSAVGDPVLTAVADRAEVDATTGDLAFIDLALADPDGNLHTTADRLVTVTVDGPGVLQGLGSANPTTEEGFTTGSHRTFDGRALAIIRPTGAGEITVTATTDGCPPVIVVIQSQEPHGGAPADQRLDFAEALA